MRRAILTLTAGLLCTAIHAQTDEKEVARLRQHVDAYMDSVRRQPDWLLSRLQMYWTSHATDVFINGETFSHAGGDRAPVPTVKYNGTRSHASSYDRPKLEQVVPYDDDEQSSVTYINRTSRQQEKTHPSKTGNNIASMNRQILGMARDAARLYTMTGDTAYAGMAMGVFDTFMQGMYYRNVPTDLNHGHQQTLVGMTTFEVIHEDAVGECTELYALLKSKGYAMPHADIYDAALKKWADNIIAGGVPHNNWDIIQANFIVKIALVLQDDSAYADGHGRSYYLDYVMNQSGIRQWSMKRLAEYGFCKQSGIWCESPGYSSMVIGELVSFANTLDEKAGRDMFNEVPAIERGLFAEAQYLFPNRMICGFGDTHPNYLGTKPVDVMADYARRHGKQELAERLEAYKRALLPDAPAADIMRYVTNTFHAPANSWLMQRTGMDKQHDLAISLNGSLGNHQHANGISMELYGKGFVLGPDAGIGRTLYSGLDYAEYYSQMPAHNTVCVNGVSSYPVMMSQHAFDVDFHASTPLSTLNSKLSTLNSLPVTCSQVRFIEPETQALQVRTNAAVKTSETGGYYIDIFRSRCTRGNDRFHDYFYHNLGQTMTLTADDGADLGLKPTQELAFAGGHLYAYSYIYNKVSADTDKNVKATFTITPENDNLKQPVTMTMWMQGAAGRTVFQALSPVNLEYERLPKYMPYKVDEQPVLTFVARQQGDAWAHPFVAVFEPSDDSEPSQIAGVSYFTPQGQDAVGIKVTMTDGRTDYIFSAPAKTRMSYGGMKVNARLAIISNGKTIIQQ